MKTVSTSIEPRHYAALVDLAATDESTVAAEIRRAVVSLLVDEVGFHMGEPPSESAPDLAEAS